MSSSHAPDSVPFSSFVDLLALTLFASESDPCLLPILADYLWLSVPVRVSCPSQPDYLRPSFPVCDSCLPDLTYLMSLRIRSCNMNFAHESASHALLHLLVDQPSTNDSPEISSFLTPSLHEFSSDAIHSFAPTSVRQCNKTFLSTSNWFCVVFGSELLVIAQSSQMTNQVQNA